MNQPREVRRAIRERRHTGHTAGLAPGYVQGNVCILPREYADEFRLYASGSVHCAHCGALMRNLALSTSAEEA